MLNKWLHPAPRNHPRRPPDDEFVRTQTRRAIVYFGLGPAVIDAFGIAAGDRNPFQMGIRIGVLLVCAYTSIGWGLSLRTNAVHFNEPPEFWAKHEAKIRPRVYYGSWVFGPPLLIASAVAQGAADRFASGLLLPPGLLCLAQIALMARKIP